MPAHLAAQWARCREWLVPALDGDTEALVRERVAGGWAQLWAGERAAMVTQCHPSPAHLHVWLGGGELAELLAMMPGTCAWARAMGLDWVSINGRPGWARLLRRHGFEMRDDQLWKALG